MSMSPARESMALILLCLSPRQRATLEEIAAAGRAVPMAALSRGRHRNLVHQDLVALWTAGVVSREIAGCQPHYRLHPEVPGLLPSVPSQPRRGQPPRPADGARVLAAARDLVAEGHWPGCRTLAGRTGMSYSAAWAWQQRLRSAELWPDTSRLSPWATVIAARRRRSPGRNRQDAARRIEPLLTATLDDLFAGSRPFGLSPDDGRLDDVRGAAVEAILDGAVEILAAPDPGARAMELARSAARREAREGRYGVRTLDWRDEQWRQREDRNAG